MKIAMELRPDENDSLIETPKTDDTFSSKRKNRESEMNSQVKVVNFCSVIFLIFFYFRSGVVFHTKDRIVEKNRFKMKMVAFKIQIRKYPKNIRINGRGMSPMIMILASLDTMIMI